MLALCLSSFQELMGLCSLSQRQRAADVQFQPARSYSRDDVIGVLHQLLAGAQKGSQFPGLAAARNKTAMVSIDSAN